MNQSECSDWQIPPGVSRGVWDYTQADHIATDYDRYFADHQLMELDLQIARQFIGLNRHVIDLGCGTGRALLPLVAEGRTGVAVDLSEQMLRVLQQKAAEDNLKIDGVRANLVDLSCFCDESVDDAICLFSTLGMIDSDNCRQACLNHVNRILRPGGVFILHVHNLWFNLFDPRGPGWLLRNLIRSRGQVHRGRGDRQYDYRGIRNFFLHVFTRFELKSLLQKAGFEVEQWNLIGAASQGRLRRPWLLPSLRARGWIVVGRKPNVD
ncbi:MAG: class I SAM-dependent methyltransferase [Planctomycetaceae bacterium]|nr:class I SAM-dependent methyltransferase [Planctomycetaceae bacterium]